MTTRRMRDQIASAHGDLGCGSSGPTNLGYVGGHDSGFATSGGKVFGAVAYGCQSRVVWLMVQCGEQVWLVE